MIKSDFSKVKRFQCGICPKNFAKKKSLTKHEEGHNSDKNFKCHMCPLYFHWERLLKEHVLTHGDAKMRDNCELDVLNADFRCNFCLETFKSRTSLGRHMHDHPPPMVDFEGAGFSCSVCTETFADQIGLDGHLCHQQPNKSVNEVQAVHEPSGFVNVSYNLLNIFVNIKSALKLSSTIPRFLILIWYLITDINFYIGVYLI